LLQCKHNKYVEMYTGRCLPASHNKYANGTDVTWRSYVMHRCQTFNAWRGQCKNRATDFRFCISDLSGQSHSRLGRVSG